MTVTEQDWKIASDREGAMSTLFEHVLFLLGEDPEREGLKDTPRRIARAWLEMTSGLHEDPTQHLERTFSADSDSMVMVTDIPFTSLCEHHFVPFVGKCHIGYVPGPIDHTKPMEPPFRIAGLSKFARVVQGYARRPQVQEQLTNQIAEAIDSYLEPQGVIVVMKAQHMCMSLRGVKAEGSWTTTNAVRGLFATNADGIKQEFFSSLVL